MTFSTYQYARFAAQQVTATAAGTAIITVPASTQYIIKDIIVTNTAVAAETLYLTIGNLTAPIFWNMSVPPAQTVHFTGLIVLNAAEVLDAYASVATGIYVTISGQTGQ
jgi:hypothetical protein